MDENILIELSKLGYLKINNRLHISSGLVYASSLHLIYGGDLEIIKYGIIIKELIDVNKDFADFCSVKENLELILSTTGLSPQKIEVIADNVIHRGEKSKSNYLIEEKIIEDSTSLSWVGMKGIIKLQAYSETQGIDLLQAIDILLRNSPPFFFRESINTDEREKKFTNLFKGCLTSENKLANAYPGKYIILEGNSGTGKDSQAEILEKRLTAQGKKVKVIIEPSDFFRDLEGYWNKEKGKVLSIEKPLFRMYAIIGDRMDQIEREIIKALNDGYIVISIRSYLSMLVYQCKNENDQLFINFLHRSNPRPDCAIIYDLDVDTCVERIAKRGPTTSVFDKKQSLEHHRPKYLNLPKADFFNFPIKVIDANGSIEQISEETLSFVLDIIK